MSRAAGGAKCAFWGCRRSLAAVALCLAFAGSAAAQPAVVVVEEPLPVYLHELERAGQLPAESATAERLSEILIQAEAHLAAGDVRQATSLLFSVVEGERFAPLSQTVSFQNAEFLLGRALAKGKAQLGADRYLSRVLARGPRAPYFVPAFRTMVDMALESGRFGAVAAHLQGLARGQDLPPDSAHELAYLKGRAAWGDWQAVETSLAQVAPSSRLHPSALYFRALASVQRGDLVAARRGFCRIAEQRDQDRISFNVDQRFFRLKDLARLALARLAHEQARYDQAYYHYFSIPEESERLQAALFEASWSMSQQGQFASARAFADQFDRLYPHSPLRPEMSLLRANLAVKTCNFDGARAEAAALVARYEPLASVMARHRSSQTERDRLLFRIARRAAGEGQDDVGRLLEVLKLDEEFRDLLAMLSEIEVDLAEALLGVKNWRLLGAMARNKAKQQPPPASVEAVRVLEESRRLMDEAGRDPALARKLGDLILDASLAAYPVSQAGPYEREARASEALARRLVRLREDTLSALRASLFRAVEEADDRLRGILAKTRLVHIDAVVGKKKKLELQISALAEGRLPAELYTKMQAEGVLADDEIYWPFEGEQWDDEYEGYR